MPANKLFIRLGLSIQQSLVVCVALLLVGATAFSVIRQIEVRYQDILKNELQAILQGMTESVRVWSSEQQLMVQNLARNGHIQELTRRLLAKPRKRSALLKASAQKEMRYEMRSYLESGLYKDYFIIAPGNFSLASSSDANVGTPNLLTRYPELLAEIWHGKTMLTPIQHSDVPLGRNGEFDDSGNETMFVATPVRNKTGKVIALLTLRINPHRTLFPILEHARIGDTGDSYAFNRHGTMLSRSRFEAQLVRIGLLRPGLSSASHLRLLDPGLDLTKADGLSSGRKDWPMTKMAASAVSGEDGFNLNGYRDYRGVPVVGAWKWDEDLGFGFTIEQDISEAYAVYYFMRLMIIGATIGVALILVVLVVVFVSGKRKLASAQKRLQSIVETAVDGIVVIDEHGNIESVNPAMEKIFGYSTKKLIGSNVSLLMPEPHSSHHNEYIEHYHRTGVNRIIGRSREVEGRHSDGKVFPIELSVNRLELDSGLRFAGVLRDISERKLAEHEIEQERDFTRDVLDSLSAHIAVLDEHGKIVQTNRAWKKFAEENGLSADHVSIGADYLQIAQPSPEAADINKKLREMLAGGIDTFSQIFPYHAGGDKCWFNMRANRFTHRNRPAIVVSYINITQQMEFEKRLQSANEQLRITSLVAETTDNAVIVTDVDGVIQWVNHGFTRLSGYEIDEAVGQKSRELLQGPETDMAVSKNIDDAMQAGERIEGEILNYHKNGTPYWLHFEIGPVYDEQGNLVQFVALEQDITEEKRLLVDLQREKETTENANKILSLTQEALDRTGIGVYWIAAEDGRILRVNDEACRHLGYSMEELLKLKVPDFDPVFTEEEYPVRVAPIFEHGWGRFETIHRTKAGVDVPVEIIVVAMPDPPLGVPMSISFSIDISDRKKAEQAIIKAREEAEEANRAKSTFLATVSHEIRTPLYGVVGTVEMLGRSKLDAEQKEMISTAMDSATMLQRIIDDILDFSKIEAGKLELERAPLTLEQLVETLGENLRHLAIKRDVELLIYCDPWLPEVKGDSVRLRQVLYNLAGNAIKFSSNLPDRRGRVIVSALMEGQEGGRANICLRVSDNGIGMSTDVQKRLFMPFVQGDETTTRRFGGTGLGLVITLRLVEMMQGSIEVESVEEKGSTFSIHISLEQVADASKNGISDLQGLKVVLVNGNKDAAWMMKNYLEHAGAEVMSVTPDEAIEACKKACEGIKEPVVVIDTEGDREMAPPMREKMRKTAKNVALRFVLVERGRRRYARPHEGDGMTLDLNAMHRATLLNAVAAVAGRESPMQEIEAPKQFVPEIDLSIDEAGKQGRLILLADDNETNRMLIKGQLRTLGFLAETASDGEQALEMWRKGDYAMLMTDCHMPVIDGYQLSETIRREETDGVRKPIVAITADALKGTSQKCVAAGMDDYLTKPIELHVLQETLKRWLPDIERKKSKRQTRGANKKQTGDVIDAQALGRLLGTQDRKTLTEYYNDFLETSAPTVEQIRTAFDESDLPLLGKLAHKLKSSARSVGANALADCCQALETVGKEENSQVADQQKIQFFSLYDQVRNWISHFSKAK